MARGFFPSQALEQWRARMSSMTDLTLFSAYRKLFGSARDGESCWWYLGTTSVKIPDFPEIPVILPETIMVYRTETVADDEFRLHWLEVGCFRDLLTGELVESWTNPITGARVTAPNSFAEGPACFTIRAAGDGLEMSLVQAHAHVLSVEAKYALIDGRVMLTQTERKIRGFPGADGSLPEPGAPGTTHALTTLTVFGDRAEIADPAVDWAGSTGVYSLDLDILPPWMGFGAMTGATRVTGVMHKATAKDRVNHAAWDRLSALFPDFFDGDGVRANW
jgi:hypothetical protein